VADGRRQRQQAARRALPGAAGPAGEVAGAQSSDQQGAEPLPIGGGAAIVRAERFGVTDPRHLPAALPHG
jgi:hypothetical protein